MTRETMEPRLANRDRPHWDPAVRDLFTEILKAGLDVYAPSRGVSYTDPAARLEEAVHEALPLCNEELQRRMKAYRDAAIELSMGGGSERGAQVAQDHFAQGCLEALGNDRQRAVR